MLRKTLLFVALAAVTCYGNPVEQAVPSDVKNIYDNVVVGEYDAAIAKTKELVRRGKENLVSEAVDNLIKDSQRNTVEFAYKLYHRDGVDIVKNYFPIQFRLLLGGHASKLIFKRDNLAMKLSWNVDGDGDRTAYGDSKDKTTEVVSWKFIPIAEDQRVYFKIFNNKWSQFLKLGTAADSDGDHNVYGSSGSDTFRHYFYLIPAKFHDQVLFYIYNREYNQGLKLGRAVDDIGDRQVYSNKDSVLGNPDMYGWYITAL